MDEENNPIKGIEILGEYAGAIYTDVDGLFKISVEKGGTPVAFFKDIDGPENGGEFLQKREDFDWSTFEQVEEADKAKAAAYALFSGAGDDSNMPTTEIPAADAADGMNIIDLLTACKLCASKGEARRLVQQGGVSVDGEKVADIAAVISADALQNGVKIKKGKKVFHKAILA